jgi:phosphopantetheine--protein transferase-like protein
MATTHIRVGADLVSVAQIARLSADPAFLARAFHPVEIGDGRPEHLAGILAAKEAFFKAVGSAPLWLAVEVVRAESGRPALRLGGSVSQLAVQQVDVSISHAGDYAIAVALVLFDGPIDA